MVEEGLSEYLEYISGCYTLGRRFIPSSMPNPDLRIGTIVMFSGSIDSTSYWKPMGDSSWGDVSLRSFSTRYWKGRLTVPSVATSRPARASVPKIKEMSWTRRFVSRALVSLERSWDSFALRQGCREMWTLARSADISREGQVGED